MGRSLILDHLAQAERHVAQGEEHIACQRELIQELSRGGHDTSVAEDLLRKFEQLQQMHVADRHRLRIELDALT